MFFVALCCPLLVEADFVDLEVLLLFLRCVLLLMKSISLTFRHVVWSLFGCPHLGKADLFDFEVLNYFLQCASFGRVDLADSEAPIFAMCSSFGEADFVGLETQF